MDRIPRKASVFYLDRKAGVLSRTENGYEFTYDPAYLIRADAQPVSFSLPLRADKYESRRMFSFFDGLLPEGWLLELTSSIAKIDPDDKLGLLLHTGGDPVGAVSIRPLEGREDV